MDNIPENTMVETPQEISKVDPVVSNIASYMTMDSRFPEQIGSIRVDLDNYSDFPTLIIPFIERLNLDKRIFEDINLPNEWGEISPDSILYGTPKGYVLSLAFILAASEVPIESHESMKSVVDGNNNWNEWNTLFDASVDKEENLGDIIEDVYPAFKEYRRDMERALELAFTNKEEFIKIFFEDEGRSINEGIKGLLGKKLTRREVLKLGMIFTLAVILSQTGCTAGRINDSPDDPHINYPPVTETFQPETATTVPTNTSLSTETATTVPTNTPPSTETPTKGPTNTPTKESMPTSAVPQGFLEDLKIYGYSIVPQGRWFSEVDGLIQQDGLNTSIQNFKYLGQEIVDDGHFILGSFNYNREEQILRIKVEPSNSFRISGSYIIPMDSYEDIEKFMKENEVYAGVLLHVIEKEEGRPLPHNPFFFTEEDWIERRRIIEELFLNEGETEKYRLSLNELWPQ